MCHVLMVPMALIALSNATALTKIQHTVMEPLGPVFARLDGMVRIAIVAA